MPFDIQYEHGGAGVMVTVTGKVALAEFKACFDKVWKNPDSKNLRYHIIRGTPDCRLDVSFDGVRELGMMVPETLRLSPKVRNAIVAENSSLMGIARFGLVVSRVWAPNARVEAFSDLPSARKWVMEQCPDLVSE